MVPRLVHYSDVENAPDEPERIGSLAGAIDTVRDAESVVVGTGDNTSPGVLALVTEAEHVLPFYEAISPDLETFGNHDFDYGPARTREIVRDSPQTWLSANVSNDGERFGADVGVRAWKILERGGYRLGFTGVTTPRTESLNPMADDLEFEAPVDAVTNATNELRDAGADAVVVCSHLGSGDDELAREVDVDVILGGHVPSTRIETIDGTLLVRPGDGGTNLATVDVAFDDDEAVPAAEIHDVTTFDLDTDVEASYRSLMAETGLTDVVSRTDDRLDRSEATLFGGECRLGNFVADAYRWATEADAALQNAGGVRTGPALSGAVTAADLVSLVPFPEPVAVAEVTGSELEVILSDAAGIDLGFAEPGWWHAHVSGLRTVWDPDTHEVSVTHVNGERIDPGKSYRLATSAYLFHTDDEFPALEPRMEVDRTDATQYEVLVEYADERGISAPIEGRIRRAEDCQKGNYRVRKGVEPED